MQALHEECERRSAAARPETELLQMREAELTVMQGYVNESQRKIQELQQRVVELEAERQAHWSTQYMGEFLPVVPPESEEQKEFRALRRTEEQIMGIPDRARKALLDAMKVAPDAGLGPTLAQSQEIQKKAHAYKLATGRMPSQREIEEWMLKR